MGRLFWKIFFAFWIALTAAAAATGSAVWWHRYSRDGADSQLAGAPPDRLLTSMAASLLTHGGIESLREWMAEIPNRRRLPLFVVDDAGHDVLGRAVPEGALARAKALASEPSAKPASTPVARHVATPQGQSYLLFVPRAAESRPSPPPFLEPWQLIAIGTASSLAVSALLAWYLARPIRNLRWAFNAAAQGKLETRVLPRMGRRRDEIADLGRDFDRMAQQLQTLVSAQARLLHDLSHELRSPLARLHAAAGLLRQDPDNLPRSLDRIEQETDRLDALVGEVLDLARLEGGTLPAPIARLDLAELVSSIVEDARFEAQASGRDVSFHPPAAAFVNGRADLLHRAIENVVRNAVKYTPVDTAVEVDLRATATCATLTVADRGPGVPEDQLARIFEPFYQSNSAQPPDGFGLGLAIAQRAINLHGGSIRATNRNAGGLRVEIELPLA
jgi:two-component system OmpR family sensor kinase